VTLDYIRNTGKPIIISSGMSTLEEVEKSVKFLLEKNKKVALLHCVSKYPCPPEDLHLGTIQFFKEKFSIPIGFSDHSVGDPTPDLVAVAAGATILEKHFSLSRDLWGSDHKVSMTPQELTDLVSGVKEVLEDPDEKKKVLESDFAQGVLYTTVRPNYNFEWKAKMDAKGINTTLCTPPSYDNVKILADIIGRVGDDGEKIKNELYKVKDYAGVNGNITLDQNGDLTSAVYDMKKIENKKAVILK